MEKLVYVLWKPEGESVGDFRQRWLGTAVPELRASGARHISVHLADEHVAAVQPVARRGTIAPPLAGSVSFWLESAQRREGPEKAVAAHSAHCHGYLTCESETIPNARRDEVAAGERVPGDYQWSCLEVPARLDFDSWLEHWNRVQVPVAIETQNTHAYVRDVVVCPLTADAPPWRGFVSEGFESGALADPLRWYRCGGSPERMREQVRRLVGSCRAFLDLARVEAHPMSLYELG